MRFPGPPLQRTVPNRISVQTARFAALQNAKPSQPEVRLEAASNGQRQRIQAR